MLNTSAAFVSVYKVILLRRLEMTHHVHKWISAYLSYRIQRVHIDNFSLSDIRLSYRKPQGSFLGPILFISYNSELENNINSHSQLSYCYADDCQLLFV